jgi:hypothetical protein
MYMDGMPRVGVLAPHIARILGLGQEEVAARLSCGCVSYLALPLISMEYADELPSRSPISTLIRQGSNILHALIQIVMIDFWTHHQQSCTCIRDNHICKLFKVPNPLIV